MHVCRHRHQVALDESTRRTHSTTCYPQNKDWIPERLSHARSPPLVIELDESWVKTRSPRSPRTFYTGELFLRNIPSTPYLVIIQGISTQKPPALVCHWYWS